MISRPTICTQNRYIVDFAQKPWPENPATPARLLSQADSSISPPYHLHPESLYRRFRAKALAGKSSHTRQTTLPGRFVDFAALPFAPRIAISSISCKSPRRKISPSSPEYSPDRIRHFRRLTICIQNRYIINFVQKPRPENPATST